MELKAFDNKFINDSVKLIAGIDEAGRGPLAGPVVAAAVIFDPKTIIPGVNDSKKLSEIKREKLFDEIVANSLTYGIGIVDNRKIDEINILQATFLAMNEAFCKLETVPDFVLVDGNKSFNGKANILPVVKGDSKSFAIASASILAKVTRDRIMRKKAERFPEFKWSKNKGYGTREHIEAIRQHGITGLHRMSFLGNILSEQQKLEFAGK